MKIFVCFLAGLLSLTGYAKRTYIAPTIVVQDYHDFRKTQWGNNTTYSTGTSMHSGYKVYVDITDASTGSGTDQTGTIELIGDSINDIVKGSQCCPARNFVHYVSLCGKTNASSTTENPGSIEWELDAGKSTRIIISGTASLPYGSASSQTYAMAISMFLRTKIVVNEDEGAVVVSVTPRPLLNSTVPVCTGTGSTRYYGKYLAMASYHSVFLNDGKPF